MLRLLQTCIVRVESICRRVLVDDEAVSEVVVWLNCDRQVLVSTVDNSDPSSDMVFVT